MNRIVCIGNRYVHGDDLGPRVYDQLTARALLNDVQVIDGGVAGLNLLRICGLYRIK
jgi:Ni,Fe-hydrogenase maturation factor